MKVVALAGGVGGAKLCDGLAANLSAENFTIIVNTGDDFDHFGLRICPDLDTVCYTLAGLANSETGWGRSSETWNVLKELTDLQAPDWFRIGDRDLATHLERTRLLRLGLPLDEITRRFSNLWKIGAKVLPMTNHPVATFVSTKKGELLPFQEYFVHQKCEPEVTGFVFRGIEKAEPAPGIFEALQNADLIIICPSNPWVSIDPILNLPGIRSELSSKWIMAVSPIVGGKAIKGPAAKMYSELGIKPSSVAVANHYQGIIKCLVIDKQDADQEAEIRQRGIIVFTTNTIMQNWQDRHELARLILDFSKTAMEGSKNL